MAWEEVWSRVGKATGHIESTAERETRCVPFIQRRPQPMQWYRLLQVDRPPQLTQTPSVSCPQVCLLGDSRACQADELF